MRVTLLDYQLHCIQLKTRMPFRYGIATMTRVPYLFLSLRVTGDSGAATGISADSLPPKWFTKDPETAIEAETAEMFGMIRDAAERSIGMSAATPFDLWLEAHRRDAELAKRSGTAPLLAHFGTSMVERALLDAVCRMADTPFHELLRTGSTGFRLDAIHPELAGATVSDLLPSAPLSRVVSRHTVGLGDPLRAVDIAAGDRVDDGLPQALADCIRAYGLRQFKIKVNGKLESDLGRLRDLARLFDDEVGDDFAFSLDGNEQFESLEQFRDYWRALSSDEGLGSLMKRLMFVEQPVHRNSALRPSLRREFDAWPDRPPIIIDESDASLDSLPIALKLGYSGTSHKNCKGVFKGIANRCLIASRSREQAERPLVMSGEDLCNIGPVSLLQDLAVMALLGIESVERNGHHYHAGLSQFPLEIREQMLESHPDLYRRTEAGWPTVRIVDGQIDLRSINAAPFGAGFAVKTGGVKRCGAKGLD